VCGGRIEEPHACHTSQKLIKNTKNKMDGEHLERVSSPSYMSQIHFQASAEVTPSKEVNFTTGSSMDSEEYGVDGFGPPPAFPTNKALGKRKLTLMSVSTSAGFRVGDAVNSEDESCSSESSKHTQLVHRIKGGASSEISSRGNSPSSVKEEEEEEEEERGQKRTYNDAMILASLSDVGSPKKKEETLEENPDEDRKHQVKLEFEASPKSHHSTSSTACTPLRSNVNSASDGVKPFALLPKPYANKRGKLVHEAGKKEEQRGARPPFPGPYGGYPYPHGPPPPHHPGPYAGYPYPYPPPPPPPGSMPPSAYYGMHGHGPPTPMPPTPEYWGQYHSPEHVPETIEPARSGAPPFHPLSSPVKSSHVVPDESDPKKSGHPHPGPPHGHAYPGPPPPGYPGYYPPPSIEYNRSFTVSVDESSPSRHSAETSPPRPEMHPSSSSSPPRPRPPPSYPESPYSGYPPPHSDPYQPYDYASASPTIQYPQPPLGNYQFRKGGRTMHSEPIILKKKFSWRNYPEVRHC